MQDDIPDDLYEAVRVVGDIMVQIDAAYEGHVEGTVLPEILCPRCKKPLDYGKTVEINGHRHATCPHAGCGFGFAQ